MTILKSLFSRALLAVALATGAGAAGADPMFHVDLNLTGFSGTGFLDVQFNQSGNPAPATATLFNFGPGFADDFDPSSVGVSGSVKDGMIVIDGSMFNDLYQAVSLGGHLAFDVLFAGLDSGNVGNAFSISLFGDDGSLFDGSLLQINVRPGETEVLAGNFATATAVPEPSAVALVMIGLLMAGVAARRRA